MRGALAVIAFLFLLGGYRAAKADLPNIAHPDAPWGKVRSVPLYIQPGMDLKLAEILSSLETTWKFEEDSLDGVKGRLKEIGFQSDWLQRIFAESEVTRVPPRYFVLKPSDQLVRDIPTTLRSGLYTELAKVPYQWNIYESAVHIENPDQTLPLIRRNFPTEFCEEFENLLWRDGLGLYFSDCHLILPLLESEKTRARFLSTLRTKKSHISTLFLLEDQQSARTVREYWSAGGKNPAAAHLIDSFLSSPNQPVLRPVVDVAHLLPGVPRKFFNHYPALEMPQADNQPDCFWTAINFFNDERSDRAYDPRALDEFFAEYYDEVTGPLEFGDLVLISDIEGGKRAPSHACNYLFDQLVFTKNGQSLKSPWLIQEISQVLKTYSRAGSDLWIQYFRLKE